jgi:phosphopantothenoylcysteine synthetase/decarboxylase
MKSIIPAIAQLGDKLANRFADNLSTFQSEDGAAQRKAIIKGRRS